MVVMPTDTLVPSRWQHADIIPRELDLPIMTDMKITVLFVLQMQTDIELH